MIQKIHRIDSINFCAKNKSNTMITAPRRQKYLSSGPNRLSGNTVTVNPTDEYNLMAVNPMIE